MNPEGEVVNGAVSPPSVPSSGPSSGDAEGAVGLPDNDPAAGLSSGVRRESASRGDFPPRGCFGKEARLLDGPAFRAVFRGGRRRNGALFALQLWLRSDRPCRIGLTVSRKVGNAVVRNRVKRVAREYFRTARADFKSGFDCVLIARPQAGEADNDRLRRDLAALFAPWL